MMKQQMMSIFTRTPLHVGAGSSVGVVDLPVMRERHTGYPVIPGSSLKGVLADLWRDDLDEGTWTRKSGSDAELLFGVDNDPNRAASGKLLVGEAKLVVFPVRSAKGGFAWLTCPLALGRLARDLGVSFDLPKVGSMSAVAASALVFEQKTATGNITKTTRNVILEEYVLNADEESARLEPVVTELLKLADDTLWQEELKAHLCLVSDEMFKYFVECTCEVAPHVKIDDETGTAADGALFSQENVPADAMFCAVFHELKPGLLDKLEAKLAENGHLLQVGADATTGLGWCSVALRDIQAH
ncbi:MAG: type III-B CRISPR module RAMP protein Cmr4 [Oligosphaeraceae bacterium]